MGPSSAHVKALGTFFVTHIFLKGPSLIIKNCFPTTTFLPPFSCMVHMPKSVYTTFFNFHIKWLFTRKEGKVFFCHGWMTEGLFENATHAITCSIWKFGSKKSSYFLLTYILDKLFKFKASWHNISECTYETSLLKTQNRSFIYHACFKFLSF